MIKKIAPKFNDETDKVIIIGMFVASILPLLFIPPLLVVFLMKERISEETFQIAKAYFNFELLLFLITLIFILPVIGWIARISLYPIIYILNIVIIVINLCAIAKEVDIKIPVPYEFI